MKQEITYEDYSKVEIKIGTVLSVKKNEKARKPSLVLEVDFGKEIGIRKALGATPDSIVLLIILESIFITAISGYIGMLIGGGILNVFNLEDYWITDPQVSSNLVMAATITLIISGTIAGYIPAKRAAGIKPIKALRDE